MRAAGYRASGRGSPYGLACLLPVFLRARKTSRKWTRLALGLACLPPVLLRAPPPRRERFFRPATTHMATPRAGSRTRSAWSGPGARTRGRFARRVDRSGRGEEFGARADATSPPLEPRRAPWIAPRAARGARARAARTSERFARRVDRSGRTRRSTRADARAEFSRANAHLPRGFGPVPKPMARAGARPNARRTISHPHRSTSRAR